jgi:Asp-tRNA(Asn)/Glu-tRNA(Gln) amidotransferase A subunit family amidase
VTQPDLDLAFTPAHEMARLVRGGALSPVELVDNALARIDQVNGDLNAFCFVWHDEARAAALAAADAVSSGATLGPLHGVPIALKDTTPTKGHTTTLGSYTHQHWVPDHDAAIATALCDAGAIIVGKTTTPEFAHALVTDSPLWGPTRNPWDLTRSPGGSSGGSGAAVASGCVPLAEGSDMGGSVRIPASWCGVVGLKPGLGRIPMDVLPGLYDDISHHGPLARCVDDARVFLAATQGPNDADLMSVTTPLDLAQAVNGDVAGLRIGVSIDLGCWAVHPEVEAAVRVAADALAGAGAVIVEINPGLTPRAELLWAELWAVFMAAYYGDFTDEFAERMDADVLRLIERGRSISAVEYKRLEIERTSVWRGISGALAGCDAMLCPTMAQPPFPAAKADQSPRHFARDDGRYHSPDMTAIFNLVAPCPALSVPIGMHAAGTPIGGQIIAHRWNEPMALRIGRALELALPQIGRPPL